jgi:ribosomal protein S6--L-glutamate ligase
MSSQQRHRIGLIVERRYLRQAITQSLLRNFLQHAVVVDTLCTEDTCFDPTSGVVRTDTGVQLNLKSYDVVIARSRKVLGVSMLAYAEAVGVTAINSPKAVQHARNKADVALALGAAGVPTAPTILADRTAMLVDLPSAWFPLILKATYGDASQGLRVVRQPEELLDLRWSDELILAQHYVENDGFDLKLYVCGERVFAMRKPSPLNASRSADAEPIEPTTEMASVARQCGRVLGLEIFGVDAIHTADGPLVIEVNEFPNFTNVAGAAEAISAYIMRRVAGIPRTVADTLPTLSWPTVGWSNLLQPFNRRVAHANRLSA